MKLRQIKLDVIRHYREWVLMQSPGVTVDDLDEYDNLLEKLERFRRWGESKLGDSDCLEVHMSHTDDEFQPMYCPKSRRINRSRGAMLPAYGRHH